MLIRNSGFFSGKNSVQNSCALLVFIKSYSIFHLDLMFTLILGQQFLQKAHLYQQRLTWNKKRNTFEIPNKVAMMALKENPIKIEFNFGLIVKKTAAFSSPLDLLLRTVRPEPIWKKVSGWWQILPQHQSIYLRGPESASIKIPPFRPKFT